MPASGQVSWEPRAPTGRIRRVHQVVVLPCSCDVPPWTSERALRGLTGGTGPLRPCIRHFREKLEWRMCTTGRGSGCERDDEPLCGHVLRVEEPCLLGKQL